MRPGPEGTRIAREPAPTDAPRQSTFAPDALIAAA